MDERWELYDAERAGRAPSTTLRRAARGFRLRLPRLLRGTAIDLGFADGAESLYLLSRRWRVHAIEVRPEAVARLVRAARWDASRLTVRVGRFEDVEIPPANLVFAGYCLHYCRRQAFDALWARLSSGILPRGVFVGHVLGNRDDLARSGQGTFLSRAELRDRLSAFEIELLDEVDQVGGRGSQDKRWHFFSVIARRREAGRDLQRS